MVTIKRIIELDQIKGIAILCVVLLHSLYIQLGNRQPYLHSLWYIQSSFVRYGVDSLYFLMARMVMPLFVLVIGINFILQMNKMQIRAFNCESLKRFYVNKLQRIVFPVFILGVIELALLRPSFSVRHLLSFVFYPVSGLGSYFVPFLLVFYFIAAPIALWIYRKSGVYIILVSLLLFPISFLIFTYSQSSVVLSAFYDYVFYIFYWAPVVALGCVIGGYLILTGGKFSVRALLDEWWFALTLIVGPALYVTAFVLSYPEVANDFWYTALPDIAVIVPFTILFLVLQYFNSSSGRTFSFFAFFGKLSLEIFLVQMIYFSTGLQMIVQDRVKALLGGPANTIASLGATYVVSLAIITFLAVIVAYCLSALLSFVKKRRLLALRHHVLTAEN